MDFGKFIPPTRQATINGLAVVGFVALVVAGIWLAAYSTRFVPTIVNGVGGAAVYLGSVFNRADEPTLSVVPTASSTIIFFGEASSTVSTGASPATPELATPVPVTLAPTTAGEKTTSTYQLNGSRTTPVLSGLPDLVATINAVGYLTTTAADSFIASSTVPSGLRPAVNFTIKNIGTNATGPWCFSASIPTSSISLYESAPQQSLNPGDYIDYTLGFDQANRGVGQTISVTANIADTANAATCARVVTESNSNNNTASARITIIGG